MKRYLLFFCCVMLAAAAAGAQAPAAPAAGTTNVEVDPIRCWWRTSAGSVRTGETFDLALTCATLDTEAVQVVPDESRLGVAVVQFAPFEVVGGAHPADIRSGARRFFQYQYTLRIINPDMIGKDVRIPDVTIHYRINSRLAQNASLQGRDLVYILPAQSVRVTSMVPADAGDIRDAGGEDFGVAESLGFRASVLDIVAITCVALGALMLLLVVLGALRRAGARTPASEQLMPTRQIVRLATRTLASVKADREQHGWNAGLVGRALSATRLAAACGTGRSVSQRLADAASTETDGRLMSAAAFRSKPRVLSSSVTAYDLARSIEKDPATGAAHQQAITSLRDALATFSQLQYGRESAPDQTALDGALAGAIDGASQIKSEHTWLGDMLRQLRGGGRAVESRA